MARQFIYFMQGLTKAYPTRKVLDNIHLSFYPDAKIGVLGVNGSGKSTLLKIMAGLDKEYNGEAWVAEGARVGYLEQEPQLDASLSVRENVMQGVAKQKAILDRYNELAVNYSDETADEMTKLQDEIEAQGLWDLDSKVDQAMDALRTPPGDEPVTNLSGGEKRRVARSGRPIDLGPTEYRLLEFFLEHPGRVFSREQLLDSVWGRDIYIDERTVDVHIRRLRKALGTAYENLVQTVRGTGYRFSTKG